MTIIISLRVWIIVTFIIEVYGSLIVDVPLKMNLIVLTLYDFSVSMNWIVLWWSCRDRNVLEN